VSSLSQSAAPARNIARMDIAMGDKKTDPVTSLR